MPDAISQPEIFKKLRAGANAAFAMLAGIQLDVFTPLKAGSMTAEQLAATMGVGSNRRRIGDQADRLEVSGEKGIRIFQPPHVKRTAIAKRQHAYL